MGEHVTRGQEPADLRAVSRRRSSASRASRARRGRGARRRPRRGRPRAGAGRRRRGDDAADPAGEPAPIEAPGGGVDLGPAGRGTGGRRTRARRAATRCRPPRPSAASWAASAAGGGETEPDALADDVGAGGVVAEPLAAGAEQRREERRDTHERVDLDDPDQRADERVWKRSARRRRDGAQPERQLAQDLPRLRVSTVVGKTRNTMTGCRSGHPDERAVRLGATTTRSSTTTHSSSQGDRDVDHRRRSGAEAAGAGRARPPRR